jgi:hypothetical protein
MILDIPIKEAILLVGHDGRTYMRELIEALNKAGYQLNPRGVRRPPVAPSVITALQRHFSPSDKRSHWTVYHEGVTLDPDKIPDKHRWPVRSYKVIE